MGLVAVLLNLQSIDTTIDQLRYRMGHLPETESVKGLVQRVASIQGELRATNNESNRLTGIVDSGEARTAEIRVHLDRLNKQMKTIIAPREAEALQNEIETLQHQMSGIDDECLVAMDDLGACEVDVTRLSAALAELESEVQASRATEAATIAEIRQLIASEEARRAIAAQLVPPHVISVYDDKRKHLGGIAIAPLKGLSCGGCHLDISRSEVDQLAKIDEDQRECPNCSRWLAL